jgi:hypothetical protein
VDSSVLSRRRLSCRLWVKRKYDTQMEWGNVDRSL